jgi:hypothetical protein
VRFNYPAVLQEDEKRELRDKAREFIKLKPQILGMSEKAIEKRFAKAA